MKRTAALTLLCLAAAWPLAGGGRAQESASTAETALTALLADPAVVKALDEIKADDARTLAEQRRITEMYRVAAAIVRLSIAARAHRNSENYDQRGRHF